MTFKKKSGTKTTAPTKPIEETPKVAEESVPPQEPEAVIEPPPEPVVAKETTPPPPPKKEAPAPDTGVGLGSLKFMLEDYITNMGPNQAQDINSLVRQQMVLRNVINGVMKSNDEDFKSAMDELVGVVRKHRKGVFNETYVYRGFEALRISMIERRRFETLLHLLLVTADNKSIETVKKNVDMNVVLKHIPDNETQQRLISYYAL